MRTTIRAKFRAHLARRRRRVSLWSPEAIGAACLAYFGGALAIRYLDSRWLLAAWLTLGVLLIARVAYHDEPPSANGARA